MNKDQRIETGEKLRHCREACVLSQKQVADALNIERSTYTKYETGDSEPGLVTLVRIAAIFNVSPAELLPSADIKGSGFTSITERYGADNPIYQLSKDERGLIARYRAMNDENKRLLREWIDKISKKG